MCHFQNKRRNDDEKCFSFCSSKGFVDFCETHPVNPPLKVNHLSRRLEVKWHTWWFDLISESEETNRTLHQVPQATDYEQTGHWQHIAMQSWDQNYLSYHMADDTTNL